MKQSWYCLAVLFPLFAASTTAAQGRMVQGADYLAAPIIPEISTVPSIVQVGSDFTVTGGGFTGGSVVSFFVSTAGGPINVGPLIPTSIQTDSLAVFLPGDLTQGEGVAGVQVIDTDQNHTESNTVLTLLQGDAAAGAPTLAQVNGVGIASNSLQTAYAVANIETTVAPGGAVVLGGSGFDTVNGVGIDLFCACSGGKVGPFFVLPSGSGLSSGSVSFQLPASGTGAPNYGPGSFQVTNLGNGYKTAAVAVAIGAQIEVTGVTEQSGIVTVSGAGFSNLTVVNLFNLQNGNVGNLGGLDANGNPVIALQSVTPTSLTFALPAGAVSGAAYVQALNPPFVPYDASSGSGGAFTID